MDSALPGISIPGFVVLTSVIKLIIHPINSKQMQVYISVARLNDAPQVRISSLPMTPWDSFESCKAWCEKHCFGYTIRKYVSSIPSVTDEILFTSK